MRHPDFILIGSSDESAGAALATVLLSVAIDHPPVAHLTLIDAELAKIAVNTFVTMKISYANMIADLCERLPGADAESVTAAVGLDRRIGSRYLRPGGPYGGPCFPRDNIALSALARRLGTRAELAEAADGVNDRRTNRIVDLVMEQCPPGGRVAILGLAYKPDTPVVERSMGMHLARALAARGHRPLVFDPMAQGSARAALSGTADFAHNLGEAMVADVMAVVTPWPDFKRLPFTPGRPQVVVDAWRIVDPTDVPSEVTLIRLGRDLAASTGRGRALTSISEAP
jgi:UDPglucose 6-dehydrogenase